MTGQAGSLSTIEPSLVEQYRNMGEHYLENAAKLWSEKEFRKASEMLWGAIAQHLKGLAACKGKVIFGLGDFYDFVKALAKEQGDDYLRKEFAELFVLHNNFYDEKIFQDDFPSYYMRTKIYVRRINKLIRIVLRQPH